MRIRTRYAVPLALAAVVVVALAGIAAAAPNGNTVPYRAVDSSRRTLPKTTSKPGR